MNEAELAIIKTLITAMEGVSTLPAAYNNRHVLEAFGAIIEKLAVALWDANLNRDTYRYTYQTDDGSTYLFILYPNRFARNKSAVFSIDKDCVEIYRHVIAELPQK